MQKTLETTESHVTIREPSTEQERTLPDTNDLKHNEIQKVSRKYSHYVQLLKTLNNINWTDNAPMSQLTPITFWFMISAQYFPRDCPLQINKLLEGTFDPQKPYDYDNDLDILEYRRTAKKLNENINEVEIDDLLLKFQEKLDEQSTWNRANLLNVQSLQRQIKPLRFQEILNTDGLLKDMCGLTPEEIEYIDKREAFIQSEAARIEELNLIQTSKQLRKNPYRSTTDDLDGAVCQVCNDGDYQDDNLIVFCSKCNICVHQRCYIINEIPQGDWECDVCQHFGYNGQYLRCPLCPRLGGAMKPTKLSVDMGIFMNNNPSYHQSTAFMSKQNQFDADFQYSSLDCMHRDITFFDDEKNQHLEPKPQRIWVHLSCLYWVPECFIDEKYDTLRGVENIDKKRFALTCNLCGIKKSGACVQCSRGSCQIAYHPECARRANKLMSINANSANKLEYLMFCDKHTPFKLKRILETKYKLYEKEIIEFFKSYERYRSQTNRQTKQKIEQKIIQKKLQKAQKILRINDYLTPKYTFSDDEVLRFAVAFRRYLEDQKIKIEINSNYEIVQVIIPEISSGCSLRVVPECLKLKPDLYQREILPYYKGQIQESDNVWNLFKFDDYQPDKLYAIYNKCVRRAARFMMELNPGKVKRQTKLLELLTRRQQQVITIEKKKEIVPTVINNEIYLQDDNLYCVCRTKFVEGNPMIQCEMCDEWFHFDCLGVKSKPSQLESVQFYCFMCEGELEPKLKKKIKTSYKKHFEDPTFYLQKQLAKKCQLNLQRLENLKLKKTQQQEQLNIMTGISVPLTPSQNSGAILETADNQMQVLVSTETKTETANVEEQMIEEHSPIKQIEEIIPITSSQPSQEKQQHKLSQSPITDRKSKPPHEIELQRSKSKQTTLFDFFKKPKV